MHMINRTMEKRKFPPRSALVIFLVLGCAFFGFTTLAGKLTDMVTPYLVYGFNGRGLSVVESFRGTIKFSNGQAVHGIRILPVDLVWAVLSLIFLLSFFFVCRHIVIWWARGRDRGLAKEISDWFQQLDKRQNPK